MAQCWTPDVIIARQEKAISCSVRILYRQFKGFFFDEAPLPMKGKRNPNGHQGRLGKQAFKQNIAERVKDYPAFKEDYGHIEGDTIVGVRHKNSVITLVELLSNVITTLKSDGRKASDIDRP